MKKRIKEILVLSTLSAFLFSCTPKNNLEETFIFAFDTAVTIKEPSNKNSGKRGDILTRYSKLFDSYNSCPEKSLFDINLLSEGEEMTISEELASALKSSFEMKEKTSGLFEPLIGNLSESWKRNLKEGATLSNEAVATYLEEIKMSSIEINGTTIKKHGKASLDFGAFAKGYALDVVKESLAEDGVTEYLYNAGSSSMIFGEKSSSKDRTFTVQFRYLPNQSFHFKNCALGITGIDQQKWTVDGVDYSHIVSPLEGSAKAKDRAVVIIHESATLCDVFSTAGWLMNNEELGVFAEKNGFKYLVIEKGAITASNYEY